MKAASINEIKKELKDRDPGELVEICLRLGRHKKENKELLTYLLFEANDPDRYVQQVKEEMEEGFEEVNPSNLYFAKKTIRKVLRIANKHIRFAGSKQAEADILLHFCTLMKAHSLPFRKSPTLANLYQNQLKKAGQALDSLHEDLQYDYRRLLDSLK